MSERDLLISDDCLAVRNFDSDILITEGHHIVPVQIPEVKLYNAVLADC